jgi:2-dehydro-3-deoxygluconokinase
MTLVQWQPGPIICVGEAMVELAPVQDGQYALGFAGDTLNTCWYLASLLQGVRELRYLTRIGDDSLSKQFLSFLTASGIETGAVVCDAKRTLGLYLINLVGAERHFTYWRDHSAARGLADDPAQLAAELDRAAHVHVTGITLAIVGAAGRSVLFAALDHARGRGARVSFDPNLRRRLWCDDNEARAATGEMAARTDIALPSFDDETSLWGDDGPRATAARFASLGVGEIVVKNGGESAYVYAGGIGADCPALEATAPRDTTGAGDSFNSGYLAARLLGADALAAATFGHRLAHEVVHWPGALVPVAAMEQARAALSESGWL